MTATNHRELAGRTFYRGYAELSRKDSAFAGRIHPGETCLLAWKRGQVCHLAVNTIEHR